MINQPDAPDIVSATPRKSLNWGLIVLLSMFGLAMGFATVYWIPSSVEIVIWFLIFDISAYLIVKRTNGKYFLHGVLVGILNSIWITSIQIIFFTPYIAHHPEEAAMISTLPMADSPRLVMLLTGAFIGVTTGLILGLFAWIAGKFVKKPSDMIRMV